MSSALTVKSCDLLKSKNGPSHKTADYETVSSRLVVRRGRSFHVRLTLSRDTSFPDDKIRFELHTGRSPRFNHKSRLYLDLIDHQAGDAKVGVRYSTINAGNTLDLEVFTPSDMAVGKWYLWMYSKVGRRRYETRSVASDNIVMLFNPWLKEDTVYMENDKWRNEYVLNENGILYYGTARRIGGMDWFFGQFEKEVLDAALQLLDMEVLTVREQCDPIEVCRHMSALVNANDDNGVLIGNWSGDYADGTSPTEWNGSVAILKKFLATGPVKYGQCWVFSGVLCSVLRSLGIPARSVTNFESAHDTDANLTIDYHYDEKFRPMSDMDEDSVWNFHVWNDVWMARPDLPEGFGGWQALDATPQELSSGVMRCGPMSIHAIKEGLIDMKTYKFDGPFIYAEVNGTKRYWRLKRKGSDDYEEYYSNTNAIGKNMSTKAVDGDYRQDVTIMYKYKEGTPEETLSFKTARKFVKFTKSERKAVSDVVKFEANIPDKVFIGKDIVAKFKFTNISSSTQEVFVSLVGKVMQYNGSVVAEILDMDIVEKIAAGKSKEVSATISASSYLSKVKNNNGIKFYALGEVKNNPQTFVYHDAVDIDKPAITVKASPSTLQLGKSTVVTVSFTNPLSTSLAAGKLRMESSAGTVEIPVSTIKGKATYTKDVTLKPRRAGERRVVVGYSSPSLSGLQGTVTLKVTSK